MVHFFLVLSESFCAAVHKTREQKKNKNDFFLIGEIYFIPDDWREQVRGRFLRR